MYIIILYIVQTMHISQIIHIGSLQLEAEVLLLAVF